MKKISSFVLATLLSATMIAQNNLAISVYVEDMVEPVPAAAKTQLTNKLNLLLTKNGVASLDYMGQFFITAFAVPQTKDVIPGPPTKYVETMDLTFYIADYTNKLVYASTSITAKGVGETEAKAYMDVFKHVNLNSEVLQKFVETGREKIIAYYDAEAPRLIQEARHKASMKEYEAALFLCSSIPAQCKYYEESLQAGKEIYQMYIDNQCLKNLQEARMAWAAQQNAEGATLAGQYLVNILPDAACYGEAMQLYSDIRQKVLDDWKFEMKQYQDGVDLEKQRIEAIKQVGVAYGNHQQPTSTNIGFLR